VTAELNKSTNSISFFNKLPLKVPLYHARWCGNEVFAPIGGVGYVKEDETILPSIGELSIAPIGNGCNFGIWYGRGWCFGPDGNKPVSIIGKILDDTSVYSEACNNCILIGASEIIIENLA